MEPTHLHVLWANADPVTAEKMVFMYTINAMNKGWWERVTLIIWGAPAKLVNEDPAIQKKIREALAAGVHISACKACTDELGITETINAMGVETKYWGTPLTEILKKNGPLLTV